MDALPVLISPTLRLLNARRVWGKFKKLHSSASIRQLEPKNSVTDPAKKASFSTLFSAADGTKMTVSPYIQGPTSEPGAARTFGGGNQTLGGIEITIGREPTNVLCHYLSGKSEDNCTAETVHV